MQIMEEAGVEASGFHGVPVFQVPTLTVKANDKRRTPLFFDKRDLDAALGNAISQKMTQREQATQAKVDRAQQELADAEKQVYKTLCTVMSVTDAPQPAKPSGWHQCNWYCTWPWHTTFLKRATHAPHCTIF